MNVTLYGIRTCDTCRKARKWLDAEGVDHTWVDLRQQPPEAERVARWLGRLSARSLRNTSGGSYRALPAEKIDWDANEWQVAFESDPMLIKRPVLEVNDEPVTVGFKPDAWAALLGK